MRPVFPLLLFQQFHKLKSCYGCYNSCFYWCCISKSGKQLNSSADSIYDCPTRFCKDGIPVQCREKFPIFCPTINQSVFSRAVAMVSNNPIANTEAALPRAEKSKVEKNPFIPAAMDNPKLDQSNSFPNSSAAYKAVLSAPPMECPTSQNSSGDIRPLRNSAKPRPKFLADS